MKALTGIDADRLEEEKRRGITIDIGFAHLELAAPSGERLRLGFVDVPGHERFVRNMLAGIGGIDLVLLVIAADEGIMPQTREHFDICRLLAVRRGITVITKSDAVDTETLEVVRMEVGRLFARVVSGSGAIAICGGQFADRRGHRGVEGGAGESGGGHDREGFGGAGAPADRSRFYNERIWHGSDGHSRLGDDTERAGGGTVPGAEERARARNSGPWRYGRAGGCGRAHSAESGGRFHRGGGARDDARDGKIHFAQRRELMRSFRCYGRRRR